MRLAFLILGVVVAWAATPFAVSYFAGASIANRGQFGDLFGAVTSLFSGLAFAGLFWALRLQSQQLELQREELKLQREEMAGARRELARQAAIQRAQWQVAVAQVAVAAKEARIQAISYDAYGVNAHTDARTRFAGEVRKIAEEIEALHKQVAAANLLV